MLINYRWTEKSIGAADVTIVTNSIERLAVECCLVLAWRGLFRIDTSDKFLVIPNTSHLFVRYNYQIEVCKSDEHYILHEIYRKHMSV